jgi:hypothetical protein
VAEDLSANTLAVLLLSPGSIEIAYRRTTAGEIPPPPGAIPCPPEIQAALETASCFAAHTAAARFLTSAVLPRALSFLFYPHRAPHSGITIVFGFERSVPACASVPPHLADGLSLAPLTAWSLKEVSRLHLELSRVNHRFAGRKLVERAKGILQTEHGMNERQAYEYLRRTSRQRRIPLAQLAEDLLGAARCP